MPTATDYHVGQTLILRDVNDRGRGPREVTVSKVGRKLVTVGEGYLAQTFRMDTGRANDNYGHSWVVTPEAYAAENTRANALARIRRAGLTPTIPSRITTEMLVAVADLLESK